MNKSYRSIWNEALGAWVAASEITTARGKRSTRAVAIHAVAGAVALFATAAAHADVTAGTSSTLNPGSAFCSAIGTPAAGAPAWTCQVPNGVGGFATISGVATRASGGGPDLTALNALVTANLGVNAVLIGTTTTRAPGDNAVAVGVGASASGGAAVAIGQSASATQLGATAVGATAQATAEHTVALGDLSRATGASAMAVGAGSNASGGGSFSAGLNSSASGFNGTAMGTLASASGFQSTAVGAGSTATGDYSSSYGINAHAGGQAATAIAFGASAAGDNDIAIGNGANTSGHGNNIAIGTLATASNTTGGAFAFGNHATATGQDAFAVGTQATASRQSAYAIGSLAQATGLESYALGYEAIAAGDYSIAQGINSTAAGAQDISIGVRAGRHAFRGSLRPSKRFFSELVNDMMKVLQLQAEPLIRFGEYQFRPDRRSVTFLDRSIVMSEPEFDVALELFFHAHRGVGIGHLRRLLPSRRVSALGWSDEALLRWIGALPWALEMQRCGWELKTSGGEIVTVGRLRSQKKASGLRAVASAPIGGRGGHLATQLATHGIS